ncbi:MAG: CBS domain-containing protein [bacterium]
MQDTTAEDLMIPLEKYPHISNKASIKEAISLFYHTRLELNGRTSLTRAILVFDDDNKLLGMVRRRDIMRGFQPKCFYGHCATHHQMIYKVEDDPNLLEIAFERFYNVIQDMANRSISEVMIRVTHTVNYDDHIIKIIYEMTDQHYSLLPVLKNGEVIGVIRTVEVMDEIRKTLEIE